MKYLNIYLIKHLQSITLHDSAVCKVLRVKWLDIKFSHHRAAGKVMS